MKYFKIITSNFLRTLKAIAFSICLFGCSAASDKASNSSRFEALAACENLYRAVFISTYYNFITTSPRTCTNCHDTPALASEIAIVDPDIAFENLLLISSNPPGSGRARSARLTLKGFITNDSHQSSGSSTYTPEIESFESQWTDVDSVYDGCVNSF